MDEPIDVFADQFQLTLSPYGCSLTFSLTSPTPPAPGSAPQSRRLATVRTSIEHLKVMTFILHKQISNVETQTRIKVDLPSEILNSLQISREDWDAFWRTA